MLQLEVMMRAEKSTLEMILTNITNEGRTRRKK
jgi:hypothetical protein